MKDRSALMCRDCGGPVVVDGNDPKQGNRCRKCINANILARYHKTKSGDPEKHLAFIAYQKAYMANVKIDVIRHYSQGSMSCCCCNEADLKFLCIDHIDGGGNDHKRSIFNGKVSGGGALYSWLRRNRFPPGLQVLCFNCNMAKGFHGECPHETTRLRLTDPSYTPTPVHRKKWKGLTPAAAPGL